MKRFISLCVLVFVAPWLYGEPKEVATVKKDSPDIAKAKKAMEAVKDAGYLVIDEYDPGKEGKGMLCRQVIMPNAWKCYSIERFTQIRKVQVGRGGGTFSVLIPCPTDVGDQGHLATSIAVITMGNGNGPGGPMNKDKYTMRIVYGKSGEGGKNPHRNPFVLVEVTDPPASGFDVRTTSWLMMPTSTMQPAQAAQYIRSKSLSSAGVTKFMKDHGLEPFKHWHDAKPGKELQRLLDEEKKKCKTPWDYFDFAAKAGLGVRYDAAVFTHDPDAVATNNRGDCGGRASLAKRLGCGWIEYVEGYVQGMDEKFGGKHGWNLGFTNNGIFVLDAGGSYIGPQTTNFIVTTMGGWNEVPDFALKFEPNHGINGGCFSGLNADFTFLHMKDASEVKLEKGPLLDYFNARVALRKKVYAPK
ncbi:MAG: hypothetical protein G01um101425_366 [Candidatus Peregrinibacteria bacterium Gr01-1014_25]|nr:MAG: hypothetical protein G01um101425_366 [Candidatus Peregrinibacteria bacterium Gr01-1014_25]